MNNDLKKFLKLLLLFVPVTAVSYVILLCLWGDFAPNSFRNNLIYGIGGYGHTFSRLEEAKKINNVDVLLVGSSHVYRGFDTRNFENAGFKTFNLGSSFQTPLQTEVLLQRYLTQLNPKVILYEVYPATFGNDGVESSLDIIANDENDIHTINMICRIPHTKTINTGIYGFYRDITGRNKSFTENQKKKEDTYIPGGYVEKELAYFTPKKQNKQQWIIDNKQIDAFDRVLKLIKDKGIKVILINAPITNNLYNSHTNNPEFDAMMKERGEYHNFNGKVILNDSLDFYDNNHLNKNGVAKFNQALLKSDILSK